MQILKSQHDFSKEHLSWIQSKLALLLDVVEKLSTSAQVQNETVVIFRRKRIVKLNDKGMGHLGKDVPLC